jgi:hypothetical protein
MLTLKEINQRNKSFWDKQNALRNARAKDPLLVAMLNYELQSPYYRFCPVAFQKSVEQIFEDAEERKKLVLSHCEPAIRQDALREQARNAGKNKRPDGLQQLIQAIVRANPVITSAQLLEEFQTFPRPEPVIDVDEKDVIFRVRIGSGEVSKSARISALKDRLSRAKKFLNSR